MCDFLLSRSPEQLLVRAPVLAVVEAKQENIKGGLGQCAAEMVAAQLVNARAGGTVARVHGAVTTGDMWRFRQLEGAALTIDTEQYPIAHVERVLGTRWFARRATAPRRGRGGSGAALAPYGPSVVV